METDHKTTSTDPVEKGSEDGRMDRIADQTRGLIEDVKEWIDLKVQLVQLELEERFEMLANQLLGALAVIVLAFVTAIFALAAAALAVGNWLGDPMWGFLVVTGALAIVTAVVHAVKPRFVRAPSNRKSKKLPGPKTNEPRVLPESTRDEKKVDQDG